MRSKCTDGETHAQSFGELDGICTFCEMAVPLATRLAEKLGLPGTSSPPPLSFLTVLLPP